RRLAREDYRGARRVYGWSFYDQGTTERAVSADLFFESILTRFGAAELARGSPWDKGERLAQLVKEQRTLLILDGLEPLRSPPGRPEGRLKDRGLRVLLRELAGHTPHNGLCVVAPRLPVADLEDFAKGTARSIPLEHLAAPAGAELLRALGVR